MHDFLDFLKLTCQVNESLNNKNPLNNKPLDYNQLARNELVNSLMLRAKSTTTSPAKVAQSESSCSKGFVYFYVFFF